MAFSFYKGADMKIKDIYRQAIEIGEKNDPRGLQGVKADLKRAKQGYDSLSEKDKGRFDKERLQNPYSDTRILYGSEDKDVRKVLVGIDMEVGEVLLADRLGNIDLIISHHPEGKALAGFYDVMHMQADILNKVGVPINVAEGLLDERVKEVERGVLPVNHTRAVDAARLLDIPFMCIHTPADNCVVKYLQSLMDRKSPETVKEIVDILREIPEYKEATTGKAGPKVVMGRETNRAGRVFVEMTGGTEGSREIFSRLAQAGVGTIVGMHLSEKHLEKVKKEHINVVIAGHISSDTLGVNLLLDKLMKAEKEKLEVIPCSGFRRFLKR